MDTPLARERILARIRSRQARGPGARPAEEREARDWLRAHPRGPLPALPADLLGTFRQMAVRLQTTLDEVALWRDAPAAVARFLAAAGLPARAVAYDTLRHLDWQGAGLDVEFRPPRDEDPNSVTGCFCAVAETGSLVFASSPGTWTSAHLLPETHVVLLPVSRIVACQEDAFDLMRRELGEIPRGFNTVSGPSRTGDIEQTIVLGAHGPYRVHVVLVHQPASA
ncbi:LUD domain-containing protein [Aquabacterium sp. A7-Y]|uniref:LutC/YkgG family protein n=1 Tax=Aquabacterium sp. A7-Y TaxID=1349605 RepID=UPI00223D5061|nr:LUD domain-containing protein [Aquabacterium sp. A7-Y]MCW7541592.1 LUD domain-containing protein [Aquabacterium sp. A7-Y]